MEPIVITGLGVVSSLGVGKAPFWESLLAGRHGISDVASFDASAYKVRRGGEIQNFDARDFDPDLEPQRYGRAAQFALVAAKLALQDAGLSPEDTPADAAGVSMGTTSGEPNLVERFNDAYVADALDRVGSEFMMQYPCHNIAGFVASRFNLAGLNPVMIPAACAAGNYAIANAFDKLRSGEAELMLAGGSDAFSRITYTGFARLLAIAPDLCRPFDKNRKGMIPGEGAAFLTLEPLSRAVRRGARIYAEIAGYGLSCDAHHMTAGHPQGDGAARAMRAALRECRMNPEDVSYISAHGTGTRSNDLHETVAVKNVFGDLAYRKPISSVKSMLGHTMGAASAMEAVVCALAVSEDRVPPTMHLEEADPECDLDYVPNQARELRVDAAMSNAYAFGGANASLILKKFE